jgi:hypothetical protein
VTKVYPSITTTFFFVPAVIPSFSDQPRENFRNFRVELAAGVP